MHRCNPHLYLAMDVPPCHVSWLTRSGNDNCGKVRSRQFVLGWTGFNLSPIPSDPFRARQRRGALNLALCFAFSARDSVLGESRSHVSHVFGCLKPSMQPHRDTFSRPASLLHFEFAFSSTHGSARLCPKGCPCTIRNAVTPLLPRPRQDFSYRTST